MVKFLLMALADVITKMVLSHAIKKSQSKIFHHIDSILPMVVEQRGTPEQVRQVFKDSVTYETNIIPAEPEIEALIRMYDPSIAQKVNLGLTAVKGVSALLK